jgi:hypothetical protein
MCSRTFGVILSGLFFSLFSRDKDASDLLMASILEVVCSFSSIPFLIVIQWDVSFLLNTLVTAILTTVFSMVGAC